MTVIIAQVTISDTALLGAWTAPSTRLWHAVLDCIAGAAPVRGLVAGFYDSPWSVVPVQILDGISSGLMGSHARHCSQDLARQRTRQPGSGFVLTIQGLGAAFSTTYGGLFAHYISYNAAFLALAVAPCMGLAVLFSRAGGTAFARTRHGRSTDDLGRCGQPNSENSVPKRFAKVTR